MKIKFEIAPNRNSYEKIWRSAGDSNPNFQIRPKLVTPTQTPANFGRRPNNSNGFPSGPSVTHMEIQQLWPQPAVEVLSYTVEPIRAENAEEPIRVENAGEPMRVGNAEEPIGAENVMDPSRESNAEEPSRESNTMDPIRAGNAVDSVSGSNEDPNRSTSKMHYRIEEGKF